MKTLEEFVASQDEEEGSASADEASNDGGD